jgi:hypothetical protein
MTPYLTLYDIISHAIEELMNEEVEIETVPEEY